jgi:hypothetical protein
MKTPDVRNASPAKPAAAPEDTRKKNGAFARLLANQPEVDPLPTSQRPEDRIVADVKAPDAPAAPRPAPRMDALANEIAVAVRGAREVEVQFDSKSFSGLNVRITQDRGRLNVRLQSDSPEACRFLSQHADTLAQRLEAKGYPRPVVHVKNGSGGGGRQEQRRERQR